MTKKTVRNRERTGNNFSRSSGMKKDMFLSEKSSERNMDKSLLTPENIGHNITLN